MKTKYTNKPKVTIVEKEVDYSKELQRKVKIVERVILPEETLESVGKAYGITRERVRQIFNRTTGMTYSVAKNKLALISERLRCFVCGDRIPYRKAKHKKILHRMYCSESCYKFTVKYDLEKPSECTHCKKLYFNFRNYKVQKKKYHLRKNFCSVACYVMYQEERGRWSMKRGTHQKVNPYKARECVACGTVYATKNKAQQFCSHVCYTKNQGKYKQGKLKHSKGGE